MPFTQAPTNDTYSSHRVPLACGIQLRAGKYTTTLDPGMKNIIPFKEIGPNGDEVLWGETRYAIRGAMVDSTTGNITRGMYVWEKTAGTVYYFMVIGTKVYTSTTGLTGSWTNVTTLLTNVTTPVRFTEFIDATNTKKLIMVDGTEGYIFTSNAAGTKITDADFPSPHVPFPVYLDGYLFLAKAGTGDVYNSDLNAPDSWTPGNFISTQMYPDDIQALLRINNYILAIGTQSGEYFYDAGNSPGTPLAKLDGATLPFGTQFPNSIAANKDTVVFLTNNGDGEATIRAIEGLKYKDIQAKFLIAQVNVVAQNPGAYSKFRGYFFRQQGELFYALCLNGTTTALPTSAGNNPTFAYSFSTGMWFELNYNGTDTFPVYFTASATTGSVYTYIAGSYGGLSFFGTWQATASQDSLDGGISIPVIEEIRTPTYSFGTLNWKVMHRLGVGYTGTGASTTIPFIVYYTDDDWNTVNAVSGYGTNNGPGGEVGGFPFFTRLGLFRQRAFKITCSSTEQHRWMFMEFDINKMQQ